jgi:hypothetical protein
MRAIVLAVIAFFFVAICIYATFDLRRDHNQINRIREECQRTYSDAGKVRECVVDLALRHARQPELP